MDSINGVQGVPGFPDAIDHAAEGGDSLPVQPAPSAPAAATTDLVGYVRRHGVLGLATAADIAAQIAAQLAESHEFALVHGNLRPADVFVDQYGSGPSISLSAPGAPPSDVAYAAPEVIEDQPADVASDLYSLGCLIWFMVAGAPPFRGTPEQVAEQQLTAPAPQLPGTIPSVVTLNTVLAALMAKDPAQRPTAEQAVAALRQVQQLAPPDEPAPTPHSASDATASAPVHTPKRPRPLLVIAALTVGALLIWGISSLVSGGAPSPAPTPSVTVSATPTASPSVTVVPHEAARTDAGRIRVGNGPHGLAVDVQARRAYVANYNDGTVSVIDLDTDSVIREIRVGKNPQSVVVDPGTGIVLVGCDGDSRIDIFETGEYRLVGRVGMGSGSIRIAVDSVSGMAYAVAQGQSAITIISLTSYLVAGSIEVGPAPRFIGVDAESSTALVGHWSVNKLSTVSLTRRGVDEQVKVGNNPNAVAIAPTRRLAFVANYGDGASGGGTVSVVDLKASDTIATIAADAGPSRVTVDETAGVAYVTCLYASTVDVIDMKSLQVTARINGVNRPTGVDVDTATGKLYVSSFDDNVVRVFKP